MDTRVNIQTSATTIGIPTITIDYPLAIVVLTTINIVKNHTSNTNKNKNK